MPFGIRRVWYGTDWNGTEVGRDGCTGSSVGCVGSSASGYAGLGLVSRGSKLYSRVPYSLFLY